MTVYRACVLALMSAVLAGQPAAAQFDQAVLMKWAMATKVRYDVAGVFHSPKVLIIGDGGDADVTDRVEMSFVYDQTGEGMVGTANVKDYPSVTTKIRTREKGCDAPNVSDPYEHHTIRKVENGLGGYLHITSVVKFAGGDAPALCAGARVKIASKTEESVDQFFVPAATLLALPSDPGNSTLVVDPKTDTIVSKDGGWTWTYKLTPVK